MAPMVVVGFGDVDRAKPLTEELTARGHHAVARTWPTTRLVAYAVAARPAIVVLDGWLSGVELRALAQNLRTVPELRVLMIGPPAPNVEVLYALASGVSGYLPTGSAPGAVADGVGALSAGLVVMPRETTLPGLGAAPGRTRFVVQWLGGQSVELTPREWEVLVLLRQAHTTAEIARRLVVASVTVRTHVAALVRKLGVNDRTALAGPPDAHG